MLVLPAHPQRIKTIIPTIGVIRQPAVPPRQTTLHQSPAPEVVGLRGTLSLQHELLFMTIGYLKKREPLSRSQDVCAFLPRCTRYLALFLGSLPACLDGSPFLFARAAAVTCVTKEPTRSGLLDMVASSQFGRQDNGFFPPTAHTIHAAATHLPANWPSSSPAHHGKFGQIRNFYEFEKRFAPPPLVTLS